MVSKVLPILTVVILTMSIKTLDSLLLLTVTPLVYAYCDKKYM